VAVRSGAASEGVLPLDPAGPRRLAVVGRLADRANTGDHGSSDVRAPHVVTPLAGLRAALPDTVFTADPAGADAAVVVVGYTAQDEGEYVGSFDPALATLYPPAPDPARWTRSPGRGTAAPRRSAATGRRCACTPTTRR
jgi:beta-glucosidase